MQQQHSQVTSVSTARTVQMQHSTACTAKSRLRDKHAQHRCSSSTARTWLRHTAHSTNAAQHRRLIFKTQSNICLTASQRSCTSQQAALQANVPCLTALQGWHPPSAAPNAQLLCVPYADPLHQVTYAGRGGRQCCAGECEAGGRWANRRLADRASEIVETTKTGNPNEPKE